MYRDFSEKSKNELLGIVSEVENEKISNFTDWIGDRWYDFESWIGKLNIRNYLNNINEYHKKVIDKNNTTKQQIKMIFRAVAEVDSTYQSKLSDMDDVLQQCITYVEQLNLLLLPTIHDVDVNYIKTNLNNLLKNIDKTLSSTDEVLDGMKTISKLMKKIYEDDKDLSNGFGLFSTVTSYIEGLYTFLTTPYSDMSDLICGILGITEDTGSAWTGVYEYLENALNEYQAGRLGKVWQNKIGDVSLICSLCGFTKEIINTCKILMDKNSEDYEKYIQSLKMANGGLDVGDAIIKVIWDKKVLTRDVTAKYQWGLPDKNAETLSKWGGIIGAAKAYISSIIGAVDKYHKVTQDGNFTMDDIGDVGMAASVKGLASIAATVTGGLSDALFDLSDRSEQIADGIKDVAVDPMVEYVQKHPVSHFFIQNTQGLKEFADNQENNVFARVGASVVGGVGTISSIAIDSVIAPVTTVASWLSSGWNHLQNTFAR